ncbi:MAG: hypothetical protein IH856_24570 [Deltaproteobacteria bacterium]|nr:hypothetical protein [Deltaproteobacteria bacterium]
MMRFVLENRYGYPREGGRPSIFKRLVAVFLSLVMAKKAIPYRGDENFLDVGCG